jgi:hypothetical protein
MDNRNRCGGEGDGDPERQFLAGLLESLPDGF